ncbi:MAG: cytochrome c biogenesis protein CcsA [Elusimicrobia bacterium]|nr:cytochrome c biogenesis protein CcsA [Elusimicrobiota bacterium]
MTAQSFLSLAAFLLYVAASAAAFAYLLTRSARAGGLMLALMGAGLAAHVLAFGCRLALFWAYPENRWFLPVNSFFGALSYMSLALTAAFFVIEARKRLVLLGAFLLPPAALCLGLAVLKADPAVGPLEPELRSYWLNIHPMLLMTAYAAFANAFGVGVALLIQERQIKSRKPSELCYRLPALDELDALNGKIIAAALPVLVLGLGMGAVWAYETWGRAWSWDPKETMALVTAVFYAEFLWLRYVSGRRGRQPVYVSMVAFACMLATFFGAEMSSGRHGFLGGGR